MKKVKSFTVLELIISMLISSIVISISYYVYFLFSAQLMKQQRKNNAISEFHLFRKVFQNDFVNAGTVKDSINDKTLIFNSDKIGNIKYLFDDENIVREGVEKSDTFNFSGKINSLKFLDDSIMLITEIRMVTTVEKEKINMIFRKQYSANQILLALPNE